MNSTFDYMLTSNRTEIVSVSGAQVKVPGEQPYLDDPAAEPGPL